MLQALERTQIFEELRLTLEISLCSTEISVTSIKQGNVQEIGMEEDSPHVCKVSPW